MSIYSGFGTRQEESVYNALVESTVKLMQGKVLSNLKGEALTDPLFKIQILKNYELMLKLEKHKYLEPKFSEAFRDTVVRIVKDQVSMPISPFLTQSKPSHPSQTSHTFHTSKPETPDTMRKSGSSFRIPSTTERSVTPTLPMVKTQSRLRHYTPIREAKADTGFLFARLKTESK